MSSSPQVRILRPEDLEKVLAYAQSRLHKQIQDPMEQQFAEWSAPWRNESLQHYLGTGWSFAASETQNGQEQFVGFVLAQPLLFIRSFTQTIWVEHLDFENENIGQMLVETVYRWSRDKHMQKVVFTDAEQAAALSGPIAGTRTREGWWELATTRMKS